MGNKLKVVPVTKGLADVPKFKTVLIAKGSGPAEPKQDPREIAKTKAEGSYVTTQEGKGRYKGLKYAQGRDKDMAKSGEGVNNGPDIKKVAIESVRSRGDTDSEAAGPQRPRNGWGGQGRGQDQAQNRPHRQGLQHRQGQA